MFFKIGAPKYFGVLTGKHLWPATLLKRDSNTPTLVFLQSLPRLSRKKNILQMV